MDLKIEKITQLDNDLSRRPDRPLLTNWYIRHGRFFADMLNRAGYYEFKNFPFEHLTGQLIEVRSGARSKRLDLSQYKQDSYFAGKKKE